MDNHFIEKMQKKYGVVATVQPVRINMPRVCAKHSKPWFSRLRKTDEGLFLREECVKAIPSDGSGGQAATHVMESGSIDSRSVPEICPWCGFHEVYVPSLGRTVGIFKCHHCGAFCCAALLVGTSVTCACGKSGNLSNRTVKDEWVPERRQVGSVATEGIKRGTVRSEPNRLALPGKVLPQLPGGKR